MRRQYKAYLLRLRRDVGQPHWRAVIEDAHTGELLRFANETEMLRYLLQSLGESSGHTTPPQKHDI